MANARIEEKAFIIKKEAVRGTAEAAPAGGVALPVLAASEVNFVPVILEDEKLRGDPETREGQGGIRVGTGALELEPGADKLGELLLSLLGAVVTDQPDVGNAPTVFRHRFTKLGSALHPMYTLFVERKTHQKKYEGLVSNQMTFNVPIDNRIAVSADVMFKNEQAGPAITPDFSTDLNSLLFSDVAIEIAGAGSSIVRSASIVVNNNTVEKRVLSGSRDAVDLCAGRLNVNGTFQMYFEDDVERDKFIATTVSAIKITAAGQILEDVQKATLELDLPRILYTAGPISEVDGILVQDFAFTAYKDAVAGYQVQAELISLVTAY